METTLTWRWARDDDAVNNSNTTPEECRAIAAHVLWLAARASSQAFSGSIGAHANALQAQGWEHAPRNDESASSYRNTTGPGLPEGER